MICSLCKGRGHMTYPLWDWGSQFQCTSALGPCVPQDCEAAAATLMDQLSVNICGTHMSRMSDNGMHLGKPLCALIVTMDNMDMESACVTHLLLHGATWSFLNLYLSNVETSLLSDKSIAVMAGHYNCDSVPGLLPTRSWQIPARNLSLPGIYILRQVACALCVLQFRVTVFCCDCCLGLA
jgi:hypothetical protein